MSVAAAVADVLPSDVALRADGPAVPEPDSAVRRSGTRPCLRGRGCGSATGCRAVTGASPTAEGGTRSGRAGAAEP
ncbi:hypothetical protein GCM10010169_01380 [Micromonospora fulviviridis]|nr:hypothetical protein GCM10010169_01380 [Micromonospora fulviviridis]